jgi:putative transcriptional regulator
MFSFVETKLFTRLVQEYLSDDEYSQLQQAIIANPEVGSVIPGSVAFARCVGASLVVASAADFGSFTFCAHGRVRSGCWLSTLRMWRRILPLTFWNRLRMKSMAKTVAKRNVGMEILEGLRQLKRGEAGRVVNVPPVGTIRERTGLSQAKFASLLGVSVRTLQEWEQGRRAPSGAARTLLMVAAKNPRALLEVA